MKWNADAFFSIGKTHLVCEDYARAGYQKNGTPFGIVCDGCSSSPDTDFGARLLAAAAAFEMQFLWQTSVKRIIQQADKSRRWVDLPPLCLDATLLRLYWDGEGVNTTCFGDGVVAARRRDGTFVLHTVDYPGNAPFYPSYYLDEQRLRLWEEHTGLRHTRRSFDSATGEWTEEVVGCEIAQPQAFGVQEFDLVVILSDGVQSFQHLVKTGTSRTLEAVPVEQVVEHVLAIKGTKGAFLSRRCRKFLTKQCVRLGWQHSDDFSAAAIWMDEPSND